MNMRKYFVFFFIFHDRFELIRYRQSSTHLVIKKSCKNFVFRKIMAGNCLLFQFPVVDYLKVETLRRLIMS